MNTETEWVVRVNRYSHNGSGYSVVESVHKTEEAARREADRVRPFRRWAIAEAAKRPGVKPGDNN